MWSNEIEAKWFFKYSQWAGDPETQFWDHYNEIIETNYLEGKFWFAISRDDNTYEAIFDLFENTVWFIELKSPDNLETVHNEKVELEKVPPESYKEYVNVNIIIRKLFLSTFVKRLKQNYTIVF